MHLGTLENNFNRTTKPPLSTHKATPVHTTNLAALVALGVGTVT